MFTLGRGVMPRMATIAFRFRLRCCCPRPMFTCGWAASFVADATREDGRRLAREAMLKSKLNPTPIRECVEQFQETKREVRTQEKEEIEMSKLQQDYPFAWPIVTTSTTKTISPPSSHPSFLSPCVPPLPLPSLSFAFSFSA